MSDATATVPAVRALARGAEVEAYFALAAATFPGYQRAHCTPAPGGSVAAGWRGFVERRPDFEPEQLRGAFEGDQLLGGYLHEERWLNVGGARLRTGYVGGVVTDPRQRGRGVASALMRDGIARAGDRGQALLVLRGIPDFYGRFGYGDVMDATEHALDPAAVLALPAPDARARPAGLDDAPALLDLHRRHYGPYTGSYARTLAQQRHLLRERAEPPLLAVDRDGAPRGYLLLPGAPDRAAAVEVAADDWPAALALLREHAGRAPPAAELRWPLPPDSPTYYRLADHLPLRSETRSRPDAGWMARPGALGALFDGLVPIWRARWRQAGGGWSGSLAIEVEGERCCLALAGGDLRRVDAPGPGATALPLTPATLARLVFGHRPAGWLVPDAPPALDVLFPTGTAWYPASNRC